MECTEVYQRVQRVFFHSRCVCVLYTSIHQVVWCMCVGSQYAWLYCDVDGTLGCVLCTLEKPDNNSYRNHTHIIFSINKMGKLQTHDVKISISLNFIFIVKNCETLVTLSSSNPVLSLNTGFFLEFIEKRVEARF